MIFIAAGAAVPVFFFIFWCALHPETIRNRGLFNTGIGAALGALLLDAIRALVGASVVFSSISGFFAALLVLAAVVLLYASASEAGLVELTDHLDKAVSGMGTQKKTMIVPLTGEQPKQKRPVDEGPIPMDEAEEPPTAPPSI
jgi:hypothetical protein